VLLFTKIKKKAPAVIKNYKIPLITNFYQDKDERKLQAHAVYRKGNIEIQRRNLQCSEGSGF